MKILMAAPFNVKGRYAGGISVVANTVADCEEIFRMNHIDLRCFETCRIERNADKEGKTSFSNIQNFFSLYKDIVLESQTQKADILYYHTSVGLALLKDLIAVRRAKNKTGIKSVIHIHFADSKKILTEHKLIEALILRFLRKYADQIVFLSQKTAEEFVERGISRNKCSVVYNFTTIRVAPEDLKAKWEQKSNRIHLLFIGSIDKRKGILDLLEALSELDSDGYELSVCGGFSDNNVKEEFERYKTNLCGKLVFHGYVSGEKRKQLYLDADVLVLPSYGEGLPLVILEAMSAGCAILSTKVGAIPEVVSDKNGYLIEAGNIGELRETLRMLMDSSQDIKAKGMENAREAYTVDDFIENMVNICRKVKDET